MIRLISIAILSLTTLALSTPAYADMKDRLRSAEASPLFQQAITPDQISAQGLSKIALHNGATLDFAKYVYLSRLDRSPRFRGLLESRSTKEFLAGSPRYEERILQLQDRLIVERTLSVSLREGACKGPKLPTAISELCFTEGSGEIRNETENYLNKTRSKLEQLKSDSVIKNGHTAGELLAMSNEALLDVLVNSDQREIRLVSVIPTEVYNAAPQSRLWNTRQRLKKSNFGEISDGTSNTLGVMESRNVIEEATSQQHTFPTQYFLTGFTLGRGISDTIEIQFAPATIITDRYFVQFNYQFAAGFGLRFPFSVDVSSRTMNRLGRSREAVNTPNNNAPTARTPANRKSTPNNRKARDHRANANQTPQVAAGENSSRNRSDSANPRSKISIKVAPVNVASNGTPAYQAVELPKSKYFNGKEFVLELSAGCSFHASIPGDDIKKDCPSINLSKSRDIDPVIGDDKTRLGTLWVNGTASGLSVNTWAGKASLDFGIEYNLSNGRIHLNAYGFNNTFINGRDSLPLVFQDESSQTFDLVNRSKVNAAFGLNSPRYGFDVELLPVTRARFELDLGIKKLKKTMGPYSLDALSLSVVSMSMGLHEGTVGSHHYSL
jgi:hypothetical protein